MRCVLVWVACALIAGCGSSDGDGGDDGAGARGAPGAADAQGPMSGDDSGGAMGSMGSMGSTDSMGDGSGDDGSTAQPSPGSGEMGSAGAGAEPAEGGDDGAGAEPGDQQPPAGDGDDDQTGVIEGSISLDAVGYTGSAQGDLIVAVMQHNPTDCVLGAGPRPILMGEATVTDVDLSEGGSESYRVEGVEPGTHYISVFLDENGNGGQPDLGEVTSVDVATLTPPTIDVTAGEVATMDLVLNFAPPPIPTDACTPL